MVKLCFTSQVVLVDDASDMAHLGQPLESYISRWRGKVELVRSGERVRLAGQFDQICPELNFGLFKAKGSDWQGLDFLESRKQLLPFFSFLTPTVRLSFGFNRGSFNEKKPLYCNALQWTLERSLRESYGMTLKDHKKSFTISLKQLCKTKIYSEYD